MSTHNNKVIIFKNTNDLLFIYSANTEEEKDNAVKDYYSDLLGYITFPKTFEDKLRSEDSSGLFNLFQTLYYKAVLDDSYYIENVMAIK